MPRSCTAGIGVATGGVSGETTISGVHEPTSAVVVSREDRPVLRKLVRQRDIRRDCRVRRVPCTAAAQRTLPSMLSRVGQLTASVGGDAEHGAVFAEAR